MEDKNNNLQNEKILQNENKQGVPPKIAPEKSKNSFKWPIFIILALLVVGGGYFAYTYFVPRGEPLPPDNHPNEPALVPVAFAQKFAEYEEVSVNITPQIPSYSVEKDLSNVINKKDFFFLSDNAKEALAKNNFVVTLPAYNQEFFSIYESNRYDYTPNFITADSIVHNYHLAFDYLLRDLEKTELKPELTELAYQMLQASQSQYEELKGTDWENAAKRNVAFFAVVDKILYPEMAIPEYVKKEVEKELLLIADHQGIAESPVMNIGRDPKTNTYIGTPQGVLSLEALNEDYSQYVPRGHYTKSEDLKAYFKAMMYLGRITFRLKEMDETKSAVLLTLALKEDGERYKRWDRIYEPTVFFVGKADDISFYDYYDLLKSIYGTEELNTALLLKDKNKFNSFIEKAKELSPPQINSMPIFEASLQPDRKEEITGFRFMGQRFTIDASIFQRLLYREVGDKTKSCADFDMTQTGCLSGARCLPKGLDISSAMGSGVATDILKEEGEFDYACYPENMAKMQEHVSGLDETTWTQNLYWGWLYSLKPLLQEKGAGWPSFMTNQAWGKKDLTAYLGSWTELKHDTILYAKQVYAELGGGGIEEKDDRGYVEPNVYLYARLAGLLKMTKEGLQIRNLLSDENAEFLEKMETLILRLKEISEKELNNQSLNDEDYELIKTYGGSLEHFWIEAFKDRGIESSNQLSEEPASIVADVATDPNGYVIEEGTGNVATIYAVVPIDGKLRIAVGGVYTQYEFAWPMSDRLTDEKWRNILSSDDAPKMADWTNAYTVYNER
ncbi:DUF3160 domain-containing protein [bacterium]|nr:MAG: DUF3160 domain-containing protein [bacterium]